MRVCILAPPHFELHKSFDKPTRSLEPAVVNLGNLLFREAVAEHVGAAEWGEESLDPRQASEQFDVLVMPLANMLSPWAPPDWAHWASSMAGFLEQAQLPVMALGMGAQANLNDHPRLSLGPEITRLARAISDQSIAIGVRGEFTASVLESIGIRNTVVIGCPSNFLSTTSDLGLRTQAKQEVGPPERLVFSGRDFDFASTHLQRSAQRRLLDYTELHNGFYVVQAETAAIQQTRHDRHDPQAAAYRSGLRRYLRPWQSDDQFRRLMSRHFISFLQVSGWLEFLSSADLHVGMRIHGSIAATQASTPSLTIAHDMRTLELCQTLGLPYTSVQRFCESSDLADAVQPNPFLGREYDKRRMELAESYRDIYLANGLQCNLAFNATDAPLQEATYQ